MMLYHAVSDELAYQVKDSTASYVYTVDTHVDKVKDVCQDIPAVKVSTHKYFQYLLVLYKQILIFITTIITYNIHIYKSTMVSINVHWH